MPDIHAVHQLARSACKRNDEKAYIKCLIDEVEQNRCLYFTKVLEMASNELLCNNLTVKKNRNLVDN
jgi:hypothetical protein